MDTAKVFTNGRSQAIRLPKECRFRDDEVYIKKLGEMVILIPKSDPWSLMLAGLEGFTADFPAERKQPAVQGRDEMQ